MTAPKPTATIACRHCGKPADLLAVDTWFHADDTVSHALCELAVWGRKAQGRPERGPDGRFKAVARQGDAG